MKSTGKNFIIAFLMILAIYQTAELWFGEFSSHNFFAFKDDFSQPGAEDEISHTLERIIINLGENKMLCRGNGIYNSAYKESADTAIAKLLRKGEVISEGIADWKSLLQSKAVIYEYGYISDGSQAEKFFNVENSNTSKIKSFDTIMLSYDRGSARLRFINSQTLWYMEILSNDTALASDINGIFEGFSSSKEDIYYISSVQNGFEIFKNNVFIPRWDGQSVNYSYLSPKMRYEGAYGRADLEREVNGFFDNPAGKWINDVEGVLNFSDESTVVKYYPNGVLEYSNYSTGSQNEENDFYTNYMSALALIKKDEGISNEFFLRDYVMEGGNYIMYFGYKANNLPILMGEELQKSTGMKDYIEVTAGMGRVSKYKRYCVDYSLETDESMVASNDFLNAVDDVYNRLDLSDEQQVNDLTLSYIDRGNNQQLSLWWIIDIEGTEYLRNVGVS